MYVFIGLGNPGKQYESTRHNVGFLAIDYFAEKHNISVTKIKHKALIGEGRIGNEKVILVKPQTFMNLSGQSVREIVNYYNVEENEIVVIYDDIDIEVGKTRIRKSGSAGTHNGMKSIIYEIQNDKFPRIRIGVGNDKKMDLASYVLSKFKGEETTAIKEAIEKVGNIMNCIIENDIDKAMNEYNKK